MPPELPACPYPGIVSFTWNDQEVFFAREDAARRLIRRIVLYRGVLLYSASGIGKSSLINARILPAALEEGFLPARLRVQPRRGEEISVEPLPFPSFFSVNSGDRAILSVEELMDRLEALRGVKDQDFAAARPLLIFDQFEEWVTLFEGARETRDRILDALVKLINDPQLPVKILISLREDYLARLEPLFKRCPALPDHYVRLTALQRDQIEKVIRGPFEKHPGVWTPEISPELAKELRARLEERADNEGVAPTEIQIVCRRLFEAGQRGDDPAVFFAAQKGVQGLLEGFLEESLDSLEPELRHPAIALLPRMLTSAGTRNVISRDDLISRVELEDGLKRPRLERALEQLEEKTRLVRRELRRDVYFFEIVSEFLVDWIRARSEALRLERARRQLTRFWIGLAALVLIVAGPVLAFLAWRESEQQKQLRTSQLLTRQAENIQDRQLRSALLLALEAVDRAHSGGWLSRPAQAKRPPDARVSTGAEEVLRKVLARCRGLVPGGPGRPVVDAALSRDRRWLAGLSPRGDLYLWEANADGPEREPRVLAGFGGPLRGFDVSPDGRRVAAVRGNDAVFLWAPDSSVPARPHILRSDVDKLASVTFAGTGRWLLAAGGDQAPRLWAVADGAPAGKGLRLGCPEESLTTRSQLSPGAGRLAVTCDDGSALVWNLESGRPPAEPQRLEAHGTEISALSFDAKGTRLATGDLDGVIHLWDLSTDVPTSRRTVLAEAPEEVSTITLSPDARRLVAVGSQGSNLSWEPDRAGSELRLSDRPEEGSSPLADFRHEGATETVFSADGSWRLTRERGGPARLWTSRNGASESPEPQIVARPPAWSATRGGGEPSSLPPAASREHHRVIARASGENWLLTEDSTQKTPHLWDLRAGSKRPIDLRSHEEVWWGVFSPDGRWLVTGDSKGQARLWDLERVRGMVKEGIDPEPVQTFSHRRRVESAAFSPDSRRLATGSEDETALWSLEKPYLVEKLPQQVGRTRNMAFSPDGRWLATGSRQLQLWRLPGSGAVGPPVILEEYPDDPSRDLLFDPKNRWLFALGPDGVVRRWTLDLQTVRDIACRWAGRNLTHQEWQQHLTGEPYRLTCPDFPEPPAETR